MSKSQESYNKKEKEKKRRKKKQAKLERREQRKKEREEGGKKTFEEMLSYVDENGNLTSTPPDPSKRKKIKAEDIILDNSPGKKTYEQTIRKGTVKFFNGDKGYGFIIDDITKDNIFVHVNNTSDTIKENDQVSFEVQIDDKGPSAINVKIIPPEK